MASRVIARRTVLQTQRPEVRIIRLSRGKVLLCFAGSAVFVIALLVSIPQGPQGGDWRAWLGVVIFGFCGLTFLVLLVRPQILVLDGTGFVIEGGLRKSSRKIAWCDVEEFFAWRLPRGGRMVAFNYRPEAKDLPKMVALSRSLGADDALPRLWEVRTDDLVAEMNAYRERAVGDLQPSLDL